MAAWAWWCILALIALFIEIATVGFAFMCLVIGAAAVALSTAIAPEMSLTWQLGIFSIVTFLSFLFVRPFVIKLFVERAADRAVPSNVDALVGKVAKVSQRIENGEGRVVVGGDDWKAEMEDSAVVVEVGDRVVVKRVESVVVVVELIK
ncbi:MAG: NfeD family protein [Rikenellaceae bacterium]